MMFHEARALEPEFIISIARARPSVSRQPGILAARNTRGVLLHGEVLTGMLTLRRATIISLTFALY